MVIGINARALLDIYTGIGQYTLNLLKEFEKIEKKRDSDNLDFGSTNGATEVKFVIVVPSESCAKILHEKKIYPRDICEINVLPEITWLPLGLRRHYWEQRQLPRFFNEYRDDSGRSIDAVFLPYVCPPWMKSYSYKTNSRKTKTFMTIHDAIPWTDDTYRTGLLSHLSHVMAKRSLKHIDQLITVSHTAAKDIAKATGIPEASLKVIYNAPGEIFQQEEWSEESMSGELMNNQNRPPPQTLTRYALYVGGYDKRKNVGQLTKMWTKYGQGPLVLVGGKVRDTKLYSDYPDVYPTNNFSLSDAKNSLTNLTKKNTLQVVQTGFLSDESLAEIYRTARVFLHFSEKEGFNIPITEAMASHIPMLLSDTPVHREIAGTAAMYVNPSDEEAIKEAFDRIWNDEKLRSDLMEKCRIVKKSYSWKRSAQAYVDLFTR
jgi:glycosyltransferase involved in cell wall biosynthesis